MSSSTDVVVVGGGPAGSAAAITLARAGRSVAVIDKARFPRDKFCGDGLTTGALRELESLGLDPETIDSWHVAHGVTIQSPSGRTCRFPLPSEGGQYATVARRVDLDAAVLDLARQAGAIVLDGHRCTNAANEADRVVVHVEGVGPIHARYGIGADGMWSPLRKMLGVQRRGYLGDWHAFRQYFRVPDAPDTDDLRVWFEPDLLPGYVWLFPLAGGRANVGFGIHRGGDIPTQRMKELWPEILARPHVRAALGPNAEPESPHRAWPIPARLDDTVLTTGRTLFVGDAAAATDPMTGEGIAQAYLSGRLAAEAIISCGPHDVDATARSYRRAVAAELLPDHRFARLLGRLLNSPLGARGAVRVAGATPWTSRNFARWLMEDYPRAALATPRRWRRGLFTAPGAFRDAA